MVTPVAGGLAVTMLSRPGGGAGGVWSRAWSAFISPCSGSLRCWSVAGLAALDLTARGPCGLGCEIPWGISASAAPRFF